MNNKFKKCIISDKYGDPFCITHNCGPIDPEQCGRIECPHCENSIYLDDEDEYRRDDGVYEDY